MVVPNKILINKLAECLVEKNLTLAVAESCTGGMLAQQCTSIEGSSRWLECGFVTYSNASKIRLLSVEANVLNEYGAVSPQIAEQMAIGALEHSNADISASITGIAGPGGGSEVKPVGTVYIATAVKNQAAHAILHTFQGDRHAIREQSTLTAIEHLIERVHG
ncbi:MAG: nicotinamide-nucleotide amidohydrolase family protein [Gammaproteobacteria bacterium]|nr:MAG: nicotinamide-nucleotide amidohydrolase family protein [Gammaproteobacteria bacterium]